MTNRLSDERLSEIGVRLLSRTVPTAEEVQAMHDELLALRAAGPVMSVEPSEAAIDAVLTALGANWLCGRLGFLITYRAIRSALIDEQQADGDAKKSHAASDTHSVTC